MVTSPPHPARSSSSVVQNAQLLQELEALSHALYQAERRGDIPPLQPSAAVTFAPHPSLQSATSVPPPLKTFKPPPIRRASSSLEPYLQEHSTGRAPLPGLSERGPSMSLPSTHPHHSRNRHSISNPRSAPPPAKLSMSSSSPTRNHFSSSFTAPPKRHSLADDSEVRSRQRIAAAAATNPIKSRNKFDRSTSRENFDIDPNDDGDDLDYYYPNLETSTTTENNKKKSSIWNWKPLRALSHIGRHKYHCVFSVHVHAIESLPPAVNGLRLAVQFCKKETKESVQTEAFRAFQSMAEFEETLYMKSTLYGSKGSSKYMAKEFILTVVAPDAEELDLGKHVIDLSRLLLDIADGKKTQKPVGGGSTTTFDLSGKAKGAKLVITFGYEILDKDSSTKFGNGSSRHGKSSPNQRPLRTSYSLPNSAHGTPRASSRALMNASPSISEPGDYLSMDHLSLDEAFPPPSAAADSMKTDDRLREIPEIDKDFNNFDRSFGRPPDDVDSPEAPPTPQQSAKTLDRKTKDDIVERNDEEGGNYEDEAEFVVVERGVEVEAFRGQASNTEMGGNGKAEIEQQQTSELSREVEAPHEPPEVEIQAKVDSQVKEKVTTQMILKTLESLLEGAAAREQSKDEPDLVSPATSFKENSSFRRREGDIRTLDNEIDLVAGEFLNLLEGDGGPGESSDSEPSSPRGLLLKQFEKEAFLDGVNLKGKEVPEFQLDEMYNESQKVAPKLSIAGNSFSLEKQSVTWSDEEDMELASMVEAAESELQLATQALKDRTRAKMVEGKEIVTLMQEWELDEKAYARSASSKKQGNSNVKAVEFPPIIKGLPPAIPLRDGGSLRSMNPSHFQSSKGNENLIMQVSKPVVVPAEMGSTVVDVFREMAAMGLENMASQALSIMPLEDVAGQSADQIAMEGLAAEKSLRYGHGTLDSGNRGRRLSLSMKTLGTNEKKSGLNDKHASVEDLVPLAMQQVEDLALEGLRIQSDLIDEDAPYALNANPAGMHYSQGVNGNKLSTETNNLLAMSISLNEWMQIDDAGVYGGSDSEKKPFSIFAENNAYCKDMSGAKAKEDGQRRKINRANQANTLTIALLVQLRDPLRNFEAVGSPMMVLVQAERVEQKLGRNLSMKGKSEGESEDEAQFEITGVHIAGLKSEEDKGWGSQKQRQSGSRWLLVHGMAKINKTHPILRSNSNTKNKELLWSISAKLHTIGKRGNVSAKLTSSVRNPDVIFANKSWKMW